MLLQYRILNTNCLSTTYSCCSCSVRYFTNDFNSHYLLPIIGHESFSSAQSFQLSFLQSIDKKEKELFQTFE